MRKIDKKDEVNGMMTCNMREDKYFMFWEMDKLSKVVFLTQKMIQ